MRLLFFLRTVKMTTPIPPAMTSNRRAAIAPTSTPTMSPVEDDASVLLGLSLVLLLGVSLVLSRRAV